MFPGEVFFWYWFQGEQGFSHFIDACDSNGSIFTQPQLLVLADPELQAPRLSEEQE